MPFSLPMIDSIENISAQDLEVLMSQGIAYVKIPDPENLQSAIDDLYDTALAFFRQPSFEKEKFPIGKELSGFADRNQGKNPQIVQQFFFRPQEPLAPFHEKREAIKIVERTFDNDIGMSLLKKIFIKLNLGDKFDMVTEDSVSSLSFPYYPACYNLNLTCERPQNVSHKGISTITLYEVRKDIYEAIVMNDKGISKQLIINKIAGFDMKMVSNLPWQKDTDAPQVKGQFAQAFIQWLTSNCGEHTHTGTLSQTDNSAFSKHKDFDFITILYVNKPGLEVWLTDERCADRWVSVQPKRGYVVVNLANALELVLNQQCKSVLHQVRVVNEHGVSEERLSIGLFIGPSWNKPIFNLVTGEQLYKVYHQDYLRDQFAQQYSDSQENQERVTVTL